MSRTPKDIQDAGKLAKAIIQGVRLFRAIYEERHPESVLEAQITEYVLETKEAFDD